MQPLMPSPGAAIAAVIAIPALPVIAAIAAVATIAAFAAVELLWKWKNKVSHYNPPAGGQ